MRHRPTIAFLVCAVFALVAPAARSQVAVAPDAGEPRSVEMSTPTGYVPPRPAPAPAAALPSSVTPADAGRVLALLRDPAALAAFEADLEALSKAANAPASAPAGAEPSVTAAPGPVQAAAPAQAAPPSQAAAAGQSAAKPAVPAPAMASKPATEQVQLNPNSLGARLVVFGSSLLNQASVQAVAAVSAVRSIPLLWRWAETMVTDPLAQELVIDTVWRVAAVVGSGFAAEWVVRRLIGRVVARFHDNAPAAHEDRPAAGADQDQEPADPEALAEAGETEAEPRHRGLYPTAWTLLRRIPFVLGRLLLDLLPVAAFLVTAYGVGAAGLADGRQTRLILLAVVNAYAFVAALMAGARMILSPEHPRLRLVHLSSEDAAYSMRWLRRIVVIGVFGYAVGAVDVLLGLSPLAQNGLLKAVGLVDTVLLGVVVLQKRHVVASWIRRRAPASTGVLAIMWSRFAAYWHWHAILFLAVAWFVWAIEVRNGYAVVMRVSLTAVAVAVGARLTLIVALGAIDRAMRPRQDDSTGPRAFSERLTAYFPLVRGIVRVAVWIVALLVLMELWGVGTLDWFFATSLGRSIIAALVAIGLTLVLALVVWEFANARIEWHLDRLTREGLNARAARLQTLRPMLRTTLLIVIAIVAGLTVLSEIGINIAPLLAGAGIVGVAIGFGSQKLVQDLITGIFLLLENAMQVGDWVTVSGLSGTVEHLSVRTIKLRAGDGSVHIIPFSAVTTVTNTNRGLGNAPVNVTVPFSEDIDRVSEELKAIVDSMQNEPEFASKMLSGLELWGVDKVDGSSVTLAGQIPCTDSGRYAVQREFNRRLKMRFEELGIAIYNPSVSYMIEMPSPHHPDGPPHGAAVPHGLVPGPDVMPRAAE